VKARAKPARNSCQYLVDEKGHRIGVVLSLKEYERLLERIEDLEDLRAADEARREGGKPVPLEVVEARLRARGTLR
jgi:hypothetical protein